MTTQPRLASAVILLRDRETIGQGIEVFMVRRAVHSEFMPDVYVFPGGTVSADDRAAEETSDVCRAVVGILADPEGRTALGNGTRAAAIRELFEEANILLAYRDEKILAVNADIGARLAAYRQAFNERKGELVEMAHAEQLQLATDRLAYFAHWITPELMPKRYDTHFFIALAPEEQEAISDRLETTEGVWMQPAAALQGFKQQQFPLAFPTYHQLRDLAVFHSVQEALEVTGARYVPTRMPLMIQEDGKRYFQLPDDDGPDSLWIV
jgi:8-oxo-dGTP pyrophosphatase MutT (NUDIX family)